VGEFTTHQPQFGTLQYAENVAGHALVGCGLAVASGGKCGPSALAGAVTSAAGPFINSHGFVAGLLVNAALGGGAAVLGGGKFEHGAITGAFGYLFNQAANVARGRAAEDLWDQMTRSAGDEVIGRNLKYYLVDEDGNPIMRNGAKVMRELDGLARARDGIIEPTEIKNGTYAKFENGQLQDAEYVRQGQIRFYGTAARAAGIDGMLLSQVAEGAPIMYRFYVGPLGASRATRQYLRYMFGRGGGEE
jgi:hypothetical protein